MGRKQKSIFNLSALTDSFINSVNKTGENTSMLTAVVFIIGGIFGIYMGVSEQYLPTLLGGPVAILIGLALAYKAWHLRLKARQRTREKHRRHSRAHQQ